MDEKQELNIGISLRNLRIRRHMKQNELAEAAGMQPAQLCSIEQGYVSPSMRTVGHILKAMGASFRELIDQSPYLGETIDANVSQQCGASGDRSGGASDDSRWVGASGGSRGSGTSGDAGPGASGGHGAGGGGTGGRTSHAILTHRTPDAKPLDPALLEKLNAIICEYLAVEDECGVSKHTTIPFNSPFTVSEDGAEILSRALRAHCNIGSAIVYDAVELLETQGVRTIFTDLTGDTESLAFFDRANDNFFIFISKELTAERQQFVMMYEIACAYLFKSLGNNTFNETAETRRFARHFAAVFLMPEDAIKATALQLNMKPDAWNYPLVLRIKSRFGISAESFIIRLNELKLLSRSLADSLKAEAHAYYDATKEEPQPEGSPKGGRILSRNGRINDLLARLGRPGITA